VPVLCLRNRNDLFSEFHRKHPHVKLLDRIVQHVPAISESDTPILFYSVKAHTCVVRNEFADAIAKHPTTRISLAPLQNKKRKLKAHMCKQRRHGHANTHSGYHKYWMRPLMSVNLTTCSSFWSNIRIYVSQKWNVMNFRTDTIYTQKLAHLF